MSACLVLTADAQKVMEDENPQLRRVEAPKRKGADAAAELTARQLQSKQAVSADGTPITLPSILAKIAPIGLKLFTDTSPDKIKNIMTDVMTDILPDAVKLLDATAPGAITETVNTILSDPKFQDTVTEVLATPKLKAVTTTVINALLKSPTLKAIASAACKVVDDGAAAASLWNARMLQGRKLQGLGGFLGDLFGGGAGTPKTELQKKFDDIIKKITPLAIEALTLPNDENKIPTLMKKAVKILPEAIELVESIDPEVITGTVESFLADSEFVNTVKEVLKNNSAVASKVINALLAVPAIKEKASAACQVVDDGADVGSVLAPPRQ